MLEKEQLPAAGVFLGRLVDPKPDAESGLKDETVMTDGILANDDPMTARAALRETLEGQDESPRP